MTWVAPWTPGLLQARCASPGCAPRDAFGESYVTGSALCVAVTLDWDGLCVQCARGTLRVQSQLRLGVER